MIQSSCRETCDGSAVLQFKLHNRHPSLGRSRFCRQPSKVRPQSRGTEGVTQQQQRPAAGGGSGCKHDKNEANHFHSHHPRAGVLIPHADSRAEHSNPTVVKFISYSAILQAPAS